MNLSQLLNGNEIPSTKRITYKELTSIIQKRLLQLNEHYVWYQFTYLEELREMYVGTLPYFIFLGRKINVEPWKVKRSLDGWVFDVDITEQIQALYMEMNKVITSEHQQDVFQNIIEQYCNIGLTLGITPNQIQHRYKQERKNMIEPFRNEIMKHYIQRRYFGT
ncbi:hypothetical protein GLW08_10720 [Pontibacillus yanchengensis]|uniref:Uncharacterized protein n=2 Tax=Pontibacillus yanchengensis TaxID=462910 RepID=A0ACC7VI00_9BACI|nr:hypothetical protein [Pontibacillus yanchengensis]MYL34341.1 hypothetical protein [Pontibacillus yanchengensis]MYL53809.1 hypothetical protein [Pontibacillus yanchengensis]